MHCNRRRARAATAARRSDGRPRHARRPRRRAPPAPPKFARPSRSYAVKQRYPKGTRIYEHFKIAMAAYGAGPKTTAAKELLVREVSCCFISSPDLAAAFDEFYGAALGMSAVRRPARVERATSPIQRIGAGRHEMGSRSNSPRAADGWELDAETAALCARRSSRRPRPSATWRPWRTDLEARDGDARGPRHAPGRLRAAPGLQRLWPSSFLYTRGEERVVFVGGGAGPGRADRYGALRRAI